MNMELIHGFIIKFSRQAGAQEQLWKRDKQATSQLDVTRTPNSKMQNVTSISVLFLQLQ
jgi:hypothetical protein